MGRGVCFLHVHGTALEGPTGGIDVKKVRDSDLGGCIKHFKSEMSLCMRAYNIVIMSSTDPQNALTLEYAIYAV